MNDYFMKINREKCFVDKRKLILDCNIGKDHYVFSYDGWNEPYPKSLTKNGENAKFEIITDYKHCIQAYFDTDTDAKVFIDRRYDHNYEYDVYYFGKHYFVSCVIPSPDGGTE